MFRMLGVPRINLPSLVITLLISFKTLHGESTCSITSNIVTCANKLSVKGRNVASHLTKGLSDLQTCFPMSMFMSPRQIKPKCSEPEPTSKDSSSAFNFLNKNVGKVFTLQFTASMLSKFVYRF